MSAIPVTFLCAVSKPMDYFPPEGLVIDYPEDNFIHEIIEHDYNRNVYDLVQTELPKNYGIYRFDGVASTGESFSDDLTDYLITGQFTPIMIPRDDWHEAGLKDFEVDSDGYFIFNQESTS